MYRRQKTSTSKNVSSLNMWDKEIELMEKELFPESSLPKQTLTQKTTSSNVIRQKVQYSCSINEIIDLYRKTFGHKSIKVSVDPDNLMILLGVCHVPYATDYDIDYIDQNVRKITNIYEDLPYNLISKEVFMNLREYLTVAHKERTSGRILDKKEKTLTYLQDRDCYGNILIAYITKKGVLHISTDYYRRKEYGFIPFDNSVIRPIRFV